MKLWDKIRKTGTSEEAYRPEQATFAVRPDTVYAPVSGVLVSIEEINEHSQEKLDSKNFYAFNPSFDKPQAEALKA